MANLRLGLQKGVTLFSWRKEGCGQADLKKRRGFVLMLEIMIIRHYNYIFFSSFPNKIRTVSAREPYMKKAKHKSTDSSRSYTKADAALKG